MKILQTCNEKTKVTTHKELPSGTVFKMPDDSRTWLKVTYIGGAYAYVDLSTSTIFAVENFFSSANGSPVETIYSDARIVLR